MASAALKVRVGIFVIVGICLAVGAVIGLFTWLGARDTKTYVTYVSESTSGLDKDAPVKYKGVKIGRVSSISVAPDGKLIEILMEVDSSFDMRPDFVARANYAGITGLRYIEIEPPKEGMREDVKREVAEEAFDPEHSVVPSTFSDLEQLGITVEKTFRNINQLDVKEISDKLTTLLGNLDVLVAELKTSEVIGNINAAVTRLNNPKISSTLDYLESTTKKLDKLLEDINAGMLSKDLDVFLEEGTLLARNLNILTYELRDTSEIEDVLQATAETVKELNQTLRQGASTMIFSKPPQPRQISGD
ncbi:MAG TPA: MlaD family protein [Candidatus Avalokitesvara rifleensis]|uniref:MlaD family protein n=1 Tax=Candidatus Avalokitesvara rifleensis TaxID=3367620 RepID=UPI0027137375|nr:MlaD family protein [Candidatus Brocadiales bacterium]